MVVVLSSPHQPGSLKNAQKNLDPHLQPTHLSLILPGLKRRGNGANGRVSERGARLAVVRLVWAAGASATTTAQLDTAVSCVRGRGIRRQEVDGQKRQDHPRGEPGGNWDDTTVHHPITFLWSGKS